MLVGSHLSSCMKKAAPKDLLDSAHCLPALSCGAVLLHPEANTSNRLHKLSRRILAWRQHGGGKRIVDAEQMSGAASDCRNESSL